MVAEQVDGDPVEAAGEQDKDRARELLVVVGTNTAVVVDPVNVGIPDVIRSVVREDK